MTQQLDPKQVRGLSDSMTKVAGLANIKNIGANLDLDSDGTLSATGGGGGGGGTLYPGYGQNIDGSMTQKASTNLFVHTAPDGENDLIDENNKISEGYLPDYLLGQVLYGGNVVPSTAIATLTDNAKSKLGTTDETITLTNDTTDITGYVANEGIYYICTADGTFAGISLLTGDWLISNGSAWKKIDNTDAVTGVKGGNEANYRLGNVNLTAENVGAVSSTGAISTESISPFVTTSMIADGAVTAAKLSQSTGTFSMEPGYVEQGNSNFVKKVGNLVTWQLRFINTSQISSEVQVATISSGFRPPQPIWNVGILTFGGTPSYVSVLDTGAVYIKSNSSIGASSSIVLGGAYLVD